MIPPCGYPFCVQSSIMNALHWCRTDRARFSALLAACLLAAVPPVPCMAQEGEPAPEPASNGAAPAPAVPEFDRGIEGVNRARAIFDKVVETYRKAPAIRDNATVTMQFIADQEYPEQSHDVSLIISREGVRLVLDDITMTAIDGTLYGEYAPKPERLFIEDFNGPLTVDLFTMQNSIFPFPHFGLCLSENPIDNLFFFTFDARLVGQRTIKDEKWGDVEQVRIESSTDGAPCTLTIDPKTNLVVRFESQISDLANEDTKWNVTTEMHPELLEQFPVEQFVIQTDNRKVVQSIGLLTAERVTADLINTPAPDFMFPDPEGNTISLKDCEGEVTVLAFWWIPSEATAPILDSLLEVRKWIDDEQIKARIVPVDCGDSVEDMDLYLKGREIEIDHWRDEGGRISIGTYYAPSWPTTVVISPAGKVVQTWVGTDPSDSFTERLRNAVKKALDEDL